MQIIDLNEMKYLQEDIDNILKKDKLRKHQRELKTKKIHTNTEYAIRERIRGRFREALKQQNIQKDKSIELYGIQIKNILNHIGVCPGNPKDYHIHSKR